MESRIVLSLALLLVGALVNGQNDTNDSGLVRCGQCTCTDVTTQDDEDCAALKEGSGSGSGSAMGELCMDTDGTTRKVYGTCQSVTEATPTTEPEVVTAKSVTEAVLPTAPTPTPPTTRMPLPTATTTMRTTLRPTTTTSRPMTATVPLPTTPPAPTPMPTVYATTGEPPVKTSGKEGAPTTSMDVILTTPQSGDSVGLEDEEKKYQGDKPKSNTALLAGVIAGCVVGSIIVGVIAALIVIKLSARFQGAYSTGEQKNGSSGSASEVFL